MSLFLSLVFFGKLLDFRYRNRGCNGKFFSQHDEICMMKPALIIQLVPANSCLVIGGLSVQIWSKTDLWARSLAGLSQNDSADLIGMH